MTLNNAVIDPGHTIEVLEAFDTARQAFVDACGAAQAATEILRNYTQRQSVPAGSPGDMPPPIPEVSDSRSAE